MSFEARSNFEAASVKVAKTLSQTENKTTKSS